MGNLNEDYEKSSVGDSKNIFNENDIFIRKIIESDYKRGFEILFRMYYSRLCNHANRFVYSKEISEDIVMEVFKGIWEKKLFKVRNLLTNYEWEIGLTASGIKNFVGTYLGTDQL